MRKPGFTMSIVDVKELVANACAPHIYGLPGRVGTAYVNHYVGAYRMMKAEISERAKVAHAPHTDTIERYEMVKRYGREDRVLTTYRRTRLYFPLPTGASALGYESPPPLDTVTRQYADSPRYVYVLMPNGKWEPIEACKIYADPPPGAVDARSRPLLPVACYGVQIKYKHSERVDCNELCVFAEKPHCTCSCGGVNHGSATVETITTLIKDDELRAIFQELGLSKMAASTVVDTSEYFKEEPSDDAWPFKIPSDGVDAYGDFTLAPLPSLNGALPRFLLDHAPARPRNGHPAASCDCPECLGWRQSVRGVAGRMCRNCAADWQKPGSMLCTRCDALSRMYA